MTIKAEPSNRYRHYFLSHSCNRFFFTQGLLDQRKYLLKRVDKGGKIFFFDIYVSKITEVWEEGFGILV